MSQKTKFKEDLKKYISYRGIDIVLHLNNGDIIELDKNRQYKEDGNIYVFSRNELVQKIHVDSVKKVELFVT